MRKFTKLELNFIISQLLAVFILHNVWYEKAIIAQGLVYAADGFCARPELTTRVELIFGHNHDVVYVYRDKNPYKDSFGRRKSLVINLGVSDYLVAYSYSPYADVLAALQAVVAPYGLHFEFDASWILYLSE